MSYCSGIGCVSIPCDMMLEKLAKEKNILLPLACPPS